MESTQDIAKSQKKSLLTNKAEGRTGGKKSDIIFLAELRYLLDLEDHAHFSRGS